MNRSLITPAATEWAIEEGRAPSSFPTIDSQGPTLLLDAVDPDVARAVRRYCAWLSRNFPSDTLIAARFDRSFQRLRRLGGRGELVIHSSDMPSNWDGPAPSVQLIHDELLAWCEDEQLTEEEQHIIGVCIHECQVRLEKKNA